MQNKALWDRLAALGGVAFVALFVVGALLPGAMPAIDDPADEVVSFFADNRGAILTGVLLQGLGVIAFVWLVASLVESMQKAGESRLATVALLGFALPFAIGAVAALTRAALAYSAAALLEPEQVQAVYQITLFADTTGSVLFAAFALAVGGAALRTGFLPRPWGWASGAMGVVAVVGATAWSRDGFWSPTGGLVIVVNIVFLVYVLGTSVLQHRAVTRAA